MIGLTVLGSTGSIGVNTLDVVSRCSDRFGVVALTANTNVELMTEQCARWRPLYAVMGAESAAGRLREALQGLGLPTEVLSGSRGLEEVSTAPETDYVMAGIVGAAGLLPTLAAARAGKRVLLANKEALVMSGRLFMDAVRASGAELLPIDSEHNAIFQCMPGDYVPGTDSTVRSGVERILLTASGGPFRGWSAHALAEVTPEQACAHPNWVMGRKISVDSATMMNKGLEVIEACWLFDVGPDRVEVLVHPQSVVHSMVEYLDGSVLAQLGNPDMRTPIAHALGWPRRMQSGVSSLDLLGTARLDFEAADPVKFPCLGLAFEAARAGGAASTVLNAANEVAVNAFLGHGIRFVDIATVVAETLTEVYGPAPASLEEVLAVDERARAIASERVKRAGSRAA